MRRLSAVLAVLLVSSAVACGDSSSGPSRESVIGTWNLQTLNGGALPFVLQATPKVELLNDQIVVANDGTFTESFNLRFTDQNGLVTSEGDTGSGTWSLNGAAISLLFAGEPTPVTAQVDGTTFTITGQGFSQVYAKQ